MTLPTLKLDDRTFEQIFRDAKLRIPTYTPEWTDFNESDPGITLLQLFSWLTETMLYQMNRLPELNYIKFLELLGMRLKPAQAATVYLTFKANPNAREVPSVPRYTQVEAPPAANGDPLIFETEDGLGLVRRPLTHVQVFDGTGFTNVTSANETEGGAFQPFGWIPQRGSALYLGFEPLAAAEGEPSPPTKDLFPQQIRWRVFKPTAELRGKPQSCNEANDPPTSPVTLIWEYKPTEKATYWRRLTLFKDDSAGFTREGEILIAGPPEIAATTEGNVAESRYWLRCRLERGSYPTEQSTSIDFIRPNTVKAVNLATARQEILGVSNGLPRQAFPLRYKPIEVDSFQLEVEVDGSEPKMCKRVDDFLALERNDCPRDSVNDAWNQKGNLLASKQDEIWYILNPITGTVQFGDDKYPVAGARIVAVKYRYGGGTAGNVDANLITTLVNLPGVDGVTNLRKAEGGRDAQTLQELQKKAPAHFRSQCRAVTAEDYKILAEGAGGVERATAIPLAHPDFPGVKVPGAVTVVIVPEAASKDDLAPQPSAELIQSVCGYLNKHRLLTTEVFVKGPRYRAVQVHAVVHANAYAAFDLVKQRIMLEINELLDPLGRTLIDEPEHKRPRIWEFGQDLYPSGFFSTILGVKDVVAVENLEVSIDGRPFDLDNQNRSRDLERLKGRVVLEDDCLFYGVHNHEITVIPYDDK
jgi:predicted phage baseplate assembly protein